MVSLSPLTAESAFHPGPNASWLLQLPEELFFRILQACTIPSILTIRQCCTLTCQYTKDRSVWIHRLLSFLAEMKIDLCGVAPDIDGLSSSDIELLVSRHLRARYHAWRYRSSSLPYTKWRISGSEGIQTVQMIRGGRFLLGCSQDTLFLWDIGFQIGRPADSETLVCTTPIGLPPGRTSDLRRIWRHRVVDSILRVAIWIPRNGNGGYGPYMCNYKIDLSAKQKEFLPTSRLLVPQGFSPGSVHSEKVTIYRTSPPALGVHYYDPPITITWDIPPPAYGSAVLRQFSIPDSMSNFAVAFTEEARPSTTTLSTLTVWELPSPSRFGTKPTQHFTYFEPFKTWNITNGLPGKVFSVVSWDDGLQDALYFDQFKVDEETLTILRRSVVPKHSEFENRLEPEFRACPTIYLPRATLGKFHENLQVLFCAFADGTRVLYWSVDETVNERNLVIHFSNARDEFPPFHVVVGNKQPIFRQWFDNSIMISIGRICILDEGKVEIWELC